MIDEQAALKALGAQIRTLRKIKGLTQEDLAALCDFDPTYVSLLERGQRNPPFSTLLKITCHLGVPLRDLVAEVK